jgi:desulfoferrodoxin-like iron-binding protein
VTPGTVNTPEKERYKEQIKMANQTGKRYECKKCGAINLVTKGGDGEIKCCGQPMEIKS